MVATPSAAQAAQAVESDKRRKTQQTMEKAKASHLTRQLQMRLQYARLKVENGWQKQNLNEVENLYFHNSQLRGPKPLAPAAAILPTTQLQQALVSSPLLSFINPKPSIPLGPTHRVTNDDLPTTEKGISVEEALIKQVLQAVLASSAQPVSRASYPQGTSSLFEVNQDSQITESSPPPSTEVAPDLPLVPQQAEGPTLSPSLQNANLTPMPTPPTSPSNSAQQQPANADATSNSIHYPALKLPRTRNNKHPAGPKGAHQNLTTKDMMDFASTSNLTYDSFWSSHSASVPSRAGGGLSWPGLIPTATTPSTNTTANANALSNTVHAAELAIPIFTPTFNNNHSLFAGIDLTLFPYPSLAFGPPPPSTVDQSQSQQ